jgi:hypothetical protein
MRPTPIQPIFCAVFDILKTPVELAPRASGLRPAL